MDKKITDYLHLYLGCEVHSLDGGSMTYTLSGIDRKGNALFYDGFGNEMWLSAWKIVLRPLSDMTEKECNELEWIFPVSDYVAKKFMLDGITPEEMKFCLSKGFDLFGLIEAGLAIDAKTIKNV